MSSLPSVRSDLFKDVKFFLADESNEQVKQLLKQGGASREFFVSNLATHIVASNTDFPEYHQAKDSGIVVVKPDWVTMSVKYSKQMPSAAFSPDNKNKLFSGIVACPSQVQVEDRDAIWAMVTFYGGRCQLAYDSNCTHLLVPKAEGEKYECALEHLDKVKIVMPDWVVDCIKAKKLLDESSYAPVQAAKPGSKSDSILTPDNNGQTTGVAINANIENAKATPSSLLSPESPSSMKLKKDSVETINTMETEEPLMEVSEEPLKEVSEEPLKEVSEEVAADKEEEESSAETGKKKGRQAAQNAMERLKTVAKLCEESDEMDIAYSDYDASASGEKQQEAVEENPDALKQVIEIPDEDKSNNCEKVKQLSEDKVVVVSSLLSGYIFFISDYPLRLDANLLSTWITVIKQHGGAVIPNYSSDCTHVLCVHQHGQYFRQALSENKYMVTAYWLNDVLNSKKIFSPKIALHIPVPFREKVLRCRNMIISVTGFEGEERKALKSMIQMIGAKYTGFLNRSNTHLICRSETGDKYKKAQEWGISCTNARWLGDIMTGGCDYPVNMKRYREFGNQNELDINVILARELLEKWRDFEEREETTDKKRKLEMLEKEMKEIEAKKPRIEAPTEVLRAPRVVFTGLNPASVRRLTELLRSLGGEPAESVKTCTHIVASKIMRTIKFLTGISVCRYIVSPEWIEKSYERQFYLDENDYILRDYESEKVYGMSLPESIDKAQTRPLFKNMTIYVTPNVRPEQKAMAEIVGCAGGKLLEMMPEASTFKSLAEQKTDLGHPSFVCVTCDDDLHLCKDMKYHGIGIHNVEFVLSGILKQEMDFYKYKL